MAVSPVTVRESLERPRQDWQKAKKTPTFCVILPVYNVETEVAKRVAAVMQVLENIQARTSVIVVNDGSTDQTSMVLEQLTYLYQQMLVINRPEQKGYGSANRAGFRTAIDHGFDYALVLDGEVPADAELIEQFLRPMLFSYDFIKATRYSPLAQVEGITWPRRFISQVANRLARMIVGLPITDFSNGVRAIKCTLLARMMTQESGPAILIEEVVQGKRLGAKFFEVPHKLNVRGSESLYSAVPSPGDYGKCLKHLFG